MSRPEHIAPPEFYYNDTEAKKYATNSHIQKVQTALTERALELLNLPDGPHYLLDIGCGSGLSGEVLEDNGHVWVGVDISPSMLNIAVDREVEGDVFLSDMGQGLFFRPGIFDGAISISAVQWLCNADKREHVGRIGERLRHFFNSLYRSLKRGGRAVIQLYPETPEQLEMITNAALKCGFTGGVLIDFPNSTKSKKYFICLFAGPPDPNQPQPRALGDEDIQANDTETVTYVNKTGKGYKRGDHHDGVKSKAWIQRKKERQRLQGKDVRPDSKYTGRRRNKFF